MKKNTLDIVVPVFNEEANIVTFHKRVVDAMDGMELDWRIIFVNDGSKDQSVSIIRCLPRSSRERVRLVNLSRNFGHQPAISAGVAQSDADATVIIDGDLQDPPELIREFVASWLAGNEIVIGERRSRRDHGLRKLGFDVFHRYFSRLSDFPIRANTGVFGLMDRRVVEQFNGLGEQHRFIPGLRNWLGYKQAYVQYDRGERNAGEAKQDLRRLVGYALDAVFSFSYKPLRLMTFVGMTICLVSFLLASLFVIKRLSGIETAETGFTTLVTLILFLGGVQLLGIGLLGEYVGRMYDEVKRRPLYIIGEIED